MTARLRYTDEQLDSDSIPWNPNSELQEIELPLVDDWVDSSCLLPAGWHDKSRTDIQARHLPKELLNSSLAPAILLFWKSTSSFADCWNLLTIGIHGSLGQSIGELYTDHGSVCEFIVLGSAPYKDEILRPGYAVVQGPVGWQENVAYRLTADYWLVLLTD